MHERDAAQGWSGSQASLNAPGATHVHVDKLTIRQVAVGHFARAQDAAGLSHCRARGTGVPTIAGVAEERGIALQASRPAGPNKRTERSVQRYPSLRRWCRPRRRRRHKAGPRRGRRAGCRPCCCMSGEAKEIALAADHRRGGTDRKGCPCAACAIAFPVGASPRCEMAEASVLAVILSVHALPTGQAHRLCRSGTAGWC